LVAGSLDKRDRSRRRRRIMGHNSGRTKAASATGRGRERSGDKAGEGSSRLGRADVRDGFRSAGSGVWTNCQPGLTNSYVPVHAFHRASLSCLSVVRISFANTDDIHESDASEEQECNGDLIEHVWQQDRQGRKPLPSTELAQDGPRNPAGYPSIRNSKFERCISQHDELQAGAQHHETTPDTNGRCRGL
jgi:hypothetical protein